MRTRAQALLCGLAIAAVPSGAMAQASRPPPVEAAGAIDAGREAASLYRERRYAEAYQRFALADRLTHSPVFVLYMARCARNLGRLLEARGLFRRVATDPLPGTASEPMRDAQRQARVELADVEQRTPALALSVEPAGARLTVDDRPVSAGRLELDPGAHRLAAVWPDGARAERSVQLVEGGAEQRLVLSRPGTSAGGASQGPVWPGLVVLGGGVVLIGVGAVSGVIALMKTNDLRDACGGTECPPDRQGEGDDVQTAANVSTAAFIAGGVLGAAGVGLLVWRPFGGDAPEVRAQPTARGARLTVAF